MSKTPNYFLISIVLALALLSGVAVYQSILMKQIISTQGKLAEQVGTLHSLAARDEKYRPLRIIRPGKRAELYPAARTFRPEVDTLEAFRQRIQEDIKTWIGLDEELLESKVEIRSLGKETLDSLGVVREEVEFSFAGNELWSLSGYLLYPAQRTGRLPAIFCLNGHAGSAEGVAGLKEDYTHSYGLSLARAGFKVLTFDWCFEGKSRLTDSRGSQYSGHDSVFEYMKTSGRTGLALYMENAFCALAALKADPGVDPERIGITGISRGGELTVYFAALFAGDSQIAACYASGAGYPFVYRRFGGGCKCTYVEKVVDNYEFSDLLVAICPIPCRIQLGLKDNILGYGDNLEEIYKAARPLYTRLGLQQRFGLDFHDGKHEYNASQAAAFFKEHLSGAGM
ncbi:MAG: acetylxylan esterase [Gemmatimonadota bacterium]|nr:acetylxylan esterase [Gemmatimonadota bacterium]